ncbi:MAG: proteasome subunit beta [Actinobacteria bacterium]|nr:proteasome subunit beta [Actinomycetota bacterium]
MKPGSPGDGFGPIGANPSFSDLLRAARPDAAPAPTVGGGAAVPPAAAHGTTVLGMTIDSGIVMAGDRRAVEGFSIADERMDKVFPADDLSCIAIAGAAGQAVEIVKLFQMELEHYEKVIGDRLSLVGKANRLAQMIRQNFPMALQGLVVVPLFGGYDERRSRGRLYRYDVTGGRWEEEDYHATGSGGRAARSTLKKRWRPGLPREEAVGVAVESLIDASEEDVGTGGPNPRLGVYPLVTTVTADGVEEVAEDEVRAAYEQLAEGSA